jgi:FkbM family methyltransferase
VLGPVGDLHDLWGVGAEENAAGRRDSIQVVSAEVCGYRLNMSRRLWPFELFALGMFVLVLSIVYIARRPVATTSPVLFDDDVVGALRTRFGPEKFSQGPEEWILRELLQDRINGVFVDVGAYQPVLYSNTYRLERDFGWSGLAIDAIRELADGYADLRPRSRFIVAFVGDRNEGETTLHVNTAIPGVSSADRSFTARFKGTIQPRTVPNRTLQSILEEAGITKFDLLTMDIELSEPAALAGFPLRDYAPSVAVVEAHGETRQWLIDYFHRHGYVVQGRYIHADPQNLYFSRPAQ